MTLSQMAKFVLGQFDRPVAASLGASNEGYIVDHDKT